MINTNYLLEAFDLIAERYRIETGSSDIPMSELHQFFSDALDLYIELESGIADYEGADHDLAA